MPAGRSSSSTRARRTRSPWRSARRCRSSWRSESSTRPAAARRHAARRSDDMAEPERNDQEWALQRRLEDVFAKLGEKFGDLTGRVETKMRSTVTFDDVGGLRQAKTGLKDRKSTRLNSSHGYISYAVFCLKKKKQKSIEIYSEKRTQT